MGQKELSLWLCLTCTINYFVEGKKLLQVKDAACGGHFHIAQGVPVSGLSSIHMIEYSRVSARTFSFLEGFLDSPH